MANEDVLLRLGISYEDADRDTAAFINRVQGRIRELLSTANAAQPAGQEQAARELAQLDQALRQIPKRYAAVTAAAKELYAITQKIGAGGSKGLLGLVVPPGVGDSTKTLPQGQLTGMLSRGQVGDIDVGTFRSSYRNEQLGLDASARAARAQQANVEAMNEAYRARLEAIRQSITNERAYAAEASSLIPLIAEEESLRKQRVALERLAVSSALRDDDTYKNAQATRIVNERLTESDIRNRTAQITDVDGNRQRLTSQDAQSTIIETRAKLEERLRVATTALGVDQASLTIERDIIALKGQVLSAEAQRVHAEKQAAEAAAIQAGQLSLASRVSGANRGQVYTVAPTGPAGTPGTINPGLITQNLNQMVAQQQAAAAALAQSQQAAAVGMTSTATAATSAAGGLNVVASAATRAAAPTKFQQLYANLHSKTGGAPMDALSAPTLKNFIGSRLLTTAAYGVSGGILYGAISGMKELVSEASELEVSLGIIEAQYAQLEDSPEAQAAGYAKVREEILGIARETGFMANEVAGVVRQLAGAFSDTQGRPNFELATGEADIALRFAKVTGLPTQEITDSLTAVSLAFNENFTTIADNIIGLEQSFGVLGPELLRFTADLAPLGAELGFTAEQLTELGAVAQMASGRSGSSLAEAFGRILPGLQERQGDIYTLLADSTASEFVDPIAAAFSEGDIPTVVAQLARAYQQLDKTTKAELTNLAGERREAQVLASILNRAPRLVEVLEGEQDYGGEFENRWGKFTETVTFQFEQLGRAVEEFGLKLFEGGLADGLTAVADGLKLVVNVGGGVLSLFSELNDFLGGIPGRLLVLAAAAKGVGGIFGMLGGLGGARFGGGLGTGTFRGGTLSPGGLLGGLLSPYAAGSFGPFRGSGAYALRPSLTNRSWLPGPSPLGNMATTGGRFGQGVAGAAATLAPIAAIAGITSLVGAIDEQAIELEKVSGNVEDRVRQRMEQGWSESRIRQTVGLNQDQGVGRDLSDFYARNFGSGDLEEVVNRGIAKFDFQTYEKQQAQVIIDLIDKGLIDAAEGDVDKLKEFINSGGEKNRDTFKGYGGAGRGFGANEDISVFNVPDDENAPYFSMSAEARDRLWSKYEKIYANATEEREAVDQYNKAVKRSSETAKSIAELELEVASGDGNIRELIAARRRLVNQLRSALEVQAASGKKRDELIQNIIDAESDLNQAIEQARADALEQADDVSKGLQLEAQLLELSGADTQTVARANIAVAQAKLGVVRNPEDRSNIAFEIIQAQRDAFESYVDEAESTGEQLRRAREGFRFDPTAIRAIYAYSLKVGDNSKAIASIAHATGQGVKQFGNRLLDSVIKFGDAGLDVVEAEIDASIRTYWGLFEVFQKLIAADISLQTTLQAVVGLANTAKKIGELEQAKDDLHDIDIPDIPESGGMDTSDLEKQREDDRKARRKRRREEAKRKAEEARQEAIALANANLDLRAALAGDDPIALAGIAQDRANLALFTATKESERVAAYAQIVEANRQMDDALRARDSAYRDLHNALTGDDPIGVAQAAVEDAKAAVAAAQGPIATALAMAEKVRADRALATALNDLLSAQADVAIAVMEQTGDTVGAAQKRLDEIHRIQRSANELGLSRSERAQLRGEEVRAQSARRDAELQERRSLIDFQLEMGNITRQQAIGSLQALLQIPKLSDEQRREILMEIKRMRDSLGGDFQFNLPSEIGLPTVYEVRRLAQGGNGPGGYNDNRTTTVNVNVRTDASPKEIGDAVASAVGDPRRNGGANRKY